MASENGFRENELRISARQRDIREMNLGTPEPGALSDAEVVERMRQEVRRGGDGWAWLHGGPHYEPFWVRNLRTLFRWRPACYQCRRVFRTREQWDRHWLSEHYGASDD